MALPIGLQRGIAAVGILPAALAVPVTAALLQDRIGENALLPVAVLGAGGLGAVVGASLPSAFGSSVSRGGAALRGAGAALGVAALGTAMLFGLVTDR